jgi:hypothetical protein
MFKELTDLQLAYLLMRMTSAKGYWLWELTEDGIYLEIAEIHLDIRAEIHMRIAREK